MAWTKTITKAGEALIASAFGATLNYTTVKAGAGSVTVSDLADQLDVTGYIKDLSIVSVSVNGSQSVLSARLNNIGITNETPLTQLGIFASINNEPEVLLVILQNDTPSMIPPQDIQPGYVFESQFNIAVSGIANFTALIDWNAYAKISDIKGMATIGEVKEIINNDLNTHNISQIAHEERFNNITQEIQVKMPQAPTSAVHGAKGNQWVELNGVALQAVVMAFEDIPIDNITNNTETNGADTGTDTGTDNTENGANKGTETDKTEQPQNIITLPIPKEIFTRSKSFNPIINGATVRIPKYPLKQTLYAIGSNFRYYSFEYDGETESKSIIVKQLGILASL